MEWIGYGLIGIGVLLFFVSFLVPNKLKSMEVEIEQLSLQMMQEQYSLKKRIKILEEEILIGSTRSPSSNPSIKTTSDKPVHHIIRNQVWTLHEKGYSLKEIAGRSALSKEDVQTILNEARTQ
ncbi:hypothetical protein [Bacillus fonticola]|uniref:hypothetical protein n=1 Tax=Bacillus fonticola TaxID=2728853 RepID=UPI001473B43E|nr:hypothetical protein [Bacillus fonticola]